MTYQTPLYKTQKKLGARLIPFAGWEMPVLYTSIIEEHNAVRNSVGIFDIGHMGLMKITGNGALDLIQKLTTNDASKLELGTAQYSMVCNEAGGVKDDILVYRFTDYFLIVANASNAEKILEWTIRAQTKIENLKENHTMLAIQGPKSVSIMEAISGLSLAKMKHRDCLEDDIFGAHCWYSRSGYTGEDGMEIFFEKEKAEEVWNKIVEAGAKPCGLGCRDTLRLEASLALYGHELEENITPLEAGLGWAVKFDKGDFIGKEALLKHKITRKLVGIELLDKIIPRQGYKIYSPESEVSGHITSGTLSPTLGKPIGMAYIDVKQSKIGTELLLEVRENLYKCKVVKMPFYKRGY